MRTSTKYSKVAMAVSLGDAILAVRILSNMDWVDLTVIFLDCDDKVLLSRYKQTRRSHPLMISNVASSLVEAIEFEREMADPISQLANIVIDTTLLKPTKLQDKLESYFHKGNRDVFRVSFISFVSFSTGTDSPVNEDSCTFKFAASTILRSADT